jgi:cytochrome o ubiquinol oxidase subunit IV
MSNGHDQVNSRADLAPGDEHVEGGIGLRVLGYLTGLGLAILLTATSFFVAGTDLVWQPSIPVALVVLAIAQMGVHLVFFLHITTGADNTNNVLALAFGVLIVVLVIGGSLWIMANLNHNMMPMDQIMQMQCEAGCFRLRQQGRSITSPSPRSWRGEGWGEGLLPQVLKKTSLP